MESVSHASSGAVGTTWPMRLANRSACAAVNRILLPPRGAVESDEQLARIAATPNSKGRERERCIIFSPWRLLIAEPLILASSHSRCRCVQEPGIGGNQLGAFAVPSEPRGEQLGDLFSYPRTARYVRAASGISGVHSVRWSRARLSRRRKRQTRRARVHVES